MFCWFMIHSSMFRIDFWILFSPWKPSNFNLVFIDIVKLLLVEFDPKPNIKVKRFLQLSDSNIMKPLFLNVYIFFPSCFILRETGWSAYATIILHYWVNIFQIFFRYLNSLNLEILDFKKLVTIRLGRNFLGKPNLVVRQFIFCCEIVFYVSVLFVLAFKLASIEIMGTCNDKPAEVVLITQERSSPKLYFGGLWDH